MNAKNCLLVAGGKRIKNLRKELKQGKMRMQKDVTKQIYYVD